MFWQKTEQFIAQTTPAQNIPGASSALCSFPWQVPLLHGKKPQSYHLHLQRKNIFASFTRTKVNLCYLGGLKSPKRALAPAATCNSAMVSRLWNSFGNLTQELHKTNLTNISTLKHKFNCNEASFCPRTMWKMLEFPTSTSFQQTKSRILAVFPFWHLLLGKITPTVSHNMQGNTWWSSPGLGTPLGRMRTSCHHRCSQNTHVPHQPCTHSPTNILSPWGAMQSAHLAHHRGLRSSKKSQF